MRMGTSHVWAGNNTDPFSTALSKCTTEFFDSGFQSSLVSCSGKRLVVRRDGGTRATGTHRHMYNLMEVRPFQVPNLLQLLVGISKISAPSPSQPKWAAKNLISNLGARSMGNNLTPIIDAIGTAADFESCYKTTRA